MMKKSIAKLTPELRAMCANTKTLREEAERARADAHTATREALHALLDLGLTTRDMAGIMGVSHQCISQWTRKWPR